MAKNKKKKKNRYGNPAKRLVNTVEEFVKRWDATEEDDPFWIGAPVTGAFDETILDLACAGHTAPLEEVMSRLGTPSEAPDGMTWRGELVIDHANRVVLVRQKLDVKPDPQIVNNPLYTSLWEDRGAMRVAPSGTNRLAFDLARGERGRLTF